MRSFFDKIHIAYLLSPCLTSFILCSLLVNVVEGYLCLQKKPFYFRVLLKWVHCQFPSLQRQVYIIMPGRKEVKYREGGNLYSRNRTKGGGTCTIVLHTYVMDELIGVIPCQSSVRLFISPSPFTTFLCLFYFIHQLPFRENILTMMHSHE